MAYAARALALLPLLVCAALWADEQPVPKPAPRALGTEQAADEVLRARAAGDQEAIVRLAQGQAPDPWYVAEILRLRGERDAALVLAGASETLVALRAYLAAREAHPDDVAAAPAIGQAFARAAQDPQAALAITEPFVGRRDTVVLLGLAYARALALANLGRPEEALAAYEEIGRAAQAMEWWAQAVRSFNAARLCAAGLGHADRELDAALRHVEAARRLGVALEELNGLRVLGTTHRQAGRLDAAVSAHREALVVAERRRGARDLVAALVDLSASLTRKGELTEARELAHRALEVSQQPQGASLRFFALAQVGDVLLELGDLEQASAHAARALELAETEKDPARIARASTGLAQTLVQRGEVRVALPHLERAAELARGLKDDARLATALSGMGSIHLALGRPAQAIQAYGQALDIRQRLGHSVAGILGDLARSHRLAGEYAKAREYHRREMELKEAMGDRQGLAVGLNSLCLLHLCLGDLPRAQSCGERALALYEALGDPIGAARTLVNLGSVHQDLGDLSRALSCQERALAIQEKVGDRGSMAVALGNMGIVYSLLGDPERARGHYERALAIYRELRNERGVAHWLAALGHHLVGEGEPERALPYLEEALAIHDEARSPATHANILLTLADARAGMGRTEDALALAERSVVLSRRLGILEQEAEGLLSVGQLRAQAGDLDAGIKDLEAAVRLARRARLPRPQIHALAVLARLHLERGQDAQALARAREALPALEETLGSLGEEEGAIARQVHSNVYAAGALAGMRLGDAAEALTFLESGRAGALLESLGGRQALGWAEIPEDVREAEASARAVQALARQDLDRLEEAGSEATREQRAAARRALEEATDRVRAAVERSQREAKRAAGLRYPRAATIEEIRGSLEEGQALVVYALALDRALALVLERESERLVDLGERAALEESCAALDCADPGADAATALDALRQRLVAPLALSDAVRTVLVSPEGALCYLPFGALLDRPVALTPSGTTHALLRAEQRSPGEGVLALGDPDYAGTSEHARALFHRGRKLTPLPATRDEVAAVGTVRLLGADASEAALRARLSERRSWRALHLACHGLIDPVRPTLSSLALTRSGDDDGFLTAADVLRLEVRASLVTLSACQTATGRVVSGEGVVGLTRAFMYAGAPRVICSLWKVDDQATAALMTRFYAEWGKDETPRVSAAEALRRAQESVRAQESWKHPYYWAAWVLWGLPE